MTAKGKRQRTVLHGERLDAAVRELGEFAEREAKRLRERHPDRPTLPAGRTPNIDSILEERFRAILEDEIVPAVRADQKGVIHPDELDRELIKKALVGLHSDTLRKIAMRTGIKHTGILEDVATRIGQHHQWNPEWIARLVLENEPEPKEERAYTERLFALAEQPDLDYVANRLDYVLGRYIRTGIARWFVFERLDFDGARINLRGTLRAYRAGVTGAPDTPSVIPLPRDEKHIEVVIDGTRALSVRWGNALESSAAVGALVTAARIRPLGHVPFLGAARADIQIDFAAASLFILDLVTSRLRRAGLRDLNLTVARFRVDDKQDASSGATEDSRPRLKAVRFEGAHLLDSPPACKLLADEGRALVDIAMTVEPQRPPEAESGRFPVRVAIERDHVAVVTGFGLVPTLAAEVHRLVVKSVIDEVLEGVADPAFLADLAVRIKKRARTTAPIERADMLHDDSDDGTELAEEDP